MSRERLENNQLGIYALALILGASLGLLLPTFAARLESLVTPVLGMLLYGMFAQIPFVRLYEAIANRRFIAALLTANFVAIPTLVWLLTRLLPSKLPLLLGVYLVLLTPCIDYVVVFTHLGKGNARLVLASTPLLLFAQMLLLPAYLWFFLGEQAAQTMGAQPFVEAFLTLIVLPFGLALATQFWAGRRHNGQVWLNCTAWLPVPFMALTLLLVVGSQMSKIEDHFASVSQIIPIYLAFLVISPLLSRWIARAVRFDREASLALAFSAGTRNSLVVLPLALAVPEGAILVSAAIVTQTLVELVGELFYIRLLALVVFPMIRTRRKGPIISDSLE